MTRVPPFDECSSGSRRPRVRPGGAGDGEPFDDNKEGPRSVVLRCYAALEDRDLAACERLLHEDVVVVSHGGELSGRASVVSYAERVFRDPSARIIAEGPNAVVTEAGPPERLTHHIIWVADGRVRRITEHADAARAGAQAQTELRRVVDQQMALRRVAELVARADAPEEILLDAVTTEASAALGGRPTTITRFDADGGATVVALCGSAIALGTRTSRADSAEQVAGVAAPIVVGGELWGTLEAHATDGPLATESGEQLAKFADLVAVAVAGAHARDLLRALADEQASLRRVAELAAAGAPSQVVLDAVVSEASTLLGELPMGLLRFSSDGSATLTATCRTTMPPGTVLPADSQGAAAEVFRTGRAARIDDYSDTPLAELTREHGLKALVAVPVAVEGSVWGVLSAASTDGPLGADTERRLTHFAKLIATSISDAQARSGLRELADEQAALRRVAEMVARGVGESELFSAVAVEASNLIEREAASLMRLDKHGEWVVVATCGGPAPVGTRKVISADDRGIIGQILRSGGPARLDDYSGIEGPAWARDELGVASSVAVPIFVDDRMWGVLGVTSPERTLPHRAERRLQQFAELITAALANAQARTELEQLAAEQAALRRVAELVARGVPPERALRGRGGRGVVAHRRGAHHGRALRRGARADCGRSERWSRPPGRPDGVRAGHWRRARAQRRSTDLRRQTALGTARRQLDRRPASGRHGASPGAVRRSRGRGDRERRLSRAADGFAGASGRHGRRDASSPPA